MNISRTFAQAALIMAAIIFVGVGTVSPVFAQAVADEVTAIDTSYDVRQHNKAIDYRKVDIKLADQVAKFGAARIGGRRFICSYTGWYKVEVTVRVRTLDTVNVGWAMGVWSSAGNQATQTKPINFDSTQRVGHLRKQNVYFCNAGESIYGGLSISGSYRYRIVYSKIHIKLVSNPIYNP